MFLRKVLIAATLAFVSIGINADLIVTLQDDGAGGVMISIKGSGVTGDRGCTDPSSCDNDIEMPDIGDYTDAEETYSLLSPIDFAPGLSIIELNVDHDNKPAFPDDPDDLYITLDPFVPPYTAYSVNGTTSLVGASFSSFFPGVYSAQTEYIETGTGFLLILSNETPAGENVVVRPPLEDVNGDPVEGAPDISFTFSDVEEGGETIVVVTGPGAGASSTPPGFRVTGLAGAPVLFDIETTATLADESFFEICIDFSGMDIAGDPDGVTLVHEVDGAWVDITTDNTGFVVCGVADSFSYFAILESLEIVNPGHAGAWFNAATSGQGQLMDIEPENQFVFLSWFTFTPADSADPFEQHWFTAQGNYMDYTVELVVYETLGGKFDDSQAVNTEAVGSATLSFADCVYGWLDYTIDTQGLSGSIPLQRAIPGSEGLCQQQQAMTTQAVDINGGMDGAWYDPNTSGQGFLIDVHPAPEGGNFIFVAWFTYGDDTASGQRWLTAQGIFEGATAAIDVYETTGGSFDDPQAVSTGKAGTMTIDFQDCSNALLSYELTDVALSNTIAISRAIPGAQALCEELAAAN